MNARKKNVQKKTSRFYIIRAVIAVAVLVFYLVLWRPARFFITEQLVYPQVQTLQPAGSSFETALQGGSIEVNYIYSGAYKELHYRPQFGFFLLVALIALLFITGRPKPYLLLAAIHFTGSILAYLFLIAGILGISLAFVITDAINGYLVPGLSLALVPLVMKGMISEKE